MVSSSTSPATSPVHGFRAWPRRVLAWPVQGYRLLLSPWLGSSCRFEPTCSRYALDALARHGAAAGSYLTAARILRCHPACAGGCDPVPAERPRLFRHLFPQASWPVEASPMAPGADAASAAPKPPALFVSQTSSSGPSS